MYCQRKGTQIDKLFEYAKINRIEKNTPANYGNDSESIEMEKPKKNFEESNYGRLKSIASRRAIAAI